MHSLGMGQGYCTVRSRSLGAVVDWHLGAVQCSQWESLRVARPGSILMYLLKILNLFDYSLSSPLLSHQGL